MVDEPKAASSATLPDIPKDLLHPPLRAPGPSVPPLPQPPAPEGNDNDTWKEFAAHTIWKYAGTLVMERDPATGMRSVSFLSLSLLLLMVQSQIIWHRGQDIPATMMQILIALLGAKLGHRGVAAFQEYIATKKVNVDADANRS